MGNGPLPKHAEFKTPEGEPAIPKVSEEIQVPIGKAIEHFGISLIELKAFYAPETKVEIKSEIKVPPNRKTYAYYDKASNRWFNGYTKIPSWFDLGQPDQYLVPGKTHTPNIIKAVFAHKEQSAKKAAKKALKG